MIKVSEAKTILRQLKDLGPNPPWEEMQNIYDQYDFPPDGFSTWYNRFTEQVQMWNLNSMKIGERIGLYINDKEEVITWTGKKIGKVTNLSYYKSGGFAPAKRVSITFEYKGMVFRGICSYETMQCFNAKRIK